ncbi:MAG: GAF domain-containing protein [bacterium]|nr:GAF domain-containing protein [bacterium]
MTERELTTPKAIWNIRPVTRILATLEAAKACRVLGPSRRGKSVVVQALVEALRGRGFHTAQLDLRRAAFGSKTVFYSGLWQTILQDFTGGTVSPLEAGKLHSKEDFTRELMAFCESHPPRAIIVDHLESAPPNLVSDLLNVLRGGAERCGGLRVVVCGSVHFSRLSPDAGGFEAFAPAVLIDDLTTAETAAFIEAECEARGIRISEEVIDILYRKTMGDRLLLTSLLNLMMRRLQGRKRLRLEWLAEAEAELLAECLNVLPEAFSAFENDPELLSFALQILDNGSIPVRDLFLPAYSETPTPLDLCGMFTRRDGVYQVKCPLWAALLQRYFTPQQIGSLYVVNGRWREAIQHLGRALKADPHRVKSSLFTTITTAIYSGSDERPPFRPSRRGSANRLLREFEYLGDGLRALYPDSAISLYHDQGQGVLKRVYPPSPSGAPTSRTSQRIKYPELLNALKGPEYSVISSDELLIPLRAEGPEDDAIGLVIIGGLFSRYQGMQRWQEIRELTQFLRQAARALRARLAARRYLTATEERAEQLDNLNLVLTTMLEHRSRAGVHLLLRLALAGITAGEGLGFNRALVFLYDEHRRALRGRLAVGHTSREQAEADYNARSALRMKDLIGLILQEPPRPSTLQASVEQLIYPVRGGEENALTRLYEAPLVDHRNKLHPRALPADLRRVLGQLPEMGGVLLPLNTGERTLGILYVDDFVTGDPLTDERYELLQTFVSQVALLLDAAERADEEEALHQMRVRLLDAQKSISTLITNSDVKDMLDEIVRQACDVMRADCAVIYMLRLEADPGSRIYEMGNISGYPPSVLDATDIPSATGGITSTIIERSQGYWDVEDVEDALLPGGYRVAESGFIQQEKIRSFIGLRLGESAADPVAVLYINWREPHRFTEAEIAVMRFYAQFAAIAIRGAHTYASIEAQKQLLQDMRDHLRQSIIAPNASDSALHHEIKRLLNSVAQTTRDAKVELILNDPDERWSRYAFVPPDDVEFQRDVMLDKHTSWVFQTGDKLTPNDHRLLFPVTIAQSVMAVLDVQGKNRDVVALRGHLNNLVDQFAMTLEYVNRTRALNCLLHIYRRLQEDNLDLTAVLNELVEDAMEALPTLDAVTLYHIDPATGHLTLGAQRGLRHPDVVELLGPLEQDAVIRAVFASDEPLTNNDYPELLSNPLAVQEEFIASIAFPLRAQQDGQLDPNHRVGCLFFNFRFRAVTQFDDFEKTFYGLFAEAASIAISLAEKRAQLREQASQARDREWRERIAALSTGLVHDLGPMVGTLPGLVNEIKGKLARGGSIDAPLDELSAIGNRTLHISEKLQDFVRTQHFTPKSILLKVIAQQAVEALEDRRPPHVHTEYAGEALDISIVADAQWLRLLLQNLILNSYHALADVTEGAFVRLLVLPGGDGVDIRVTDNGKGIPPDHFETIFHAGFSTKNREGSLMRGVGLHYCQQIAQVHGGTLLLEWSEVGVGSTFLLHLPLEARPDLREQKR